MGFQLVDVRWQRLTADGQAIDSRGQKATAASIRMLECFSLKHIKTTILPPVILTHVFEKYPLKD